MPGIDDISHILQATGVTAGSALMLVVIAFMKGWIISRAVYLRETQRADRMEERLWRMHETAKQMNGVTKEAVELTGKVVDKVVKKGG